MMGLLTAVMMLVAVLSAAMPDECSWKELVANTAYW